MTSQAPGNKKIFDQLGPGPKGWARVVGPNGPSVAGKNYNCYGHDDGERSAWQSGGSASGRVENAIGSALFTWSSCAFTFAVIR